MTLQPLRNTSREVAGDGVQTSDPSPVQGIPQIQAGCEDRVVELASGDADRLLLAKRYAFLLLPMPSRGSERWWIFHLEATGW